MIDRFDCVDNEYAMEGIIEGPKAGKTDERFLLRPSKEKGNSPTYREVIPYILGL